MWTESPISSLPLATSLLPSTSTKLLPEQHSGSLSHGAGEELGVGGLVVGNRVGGMEGCAGASVGDMLDTQIHNTQLKVPSASFCSAMYSIIVPM